MPDSTNGFTGTEIVNRVLQYIGTSDSATETWVQNSLALAEFRFCKMHNWRFLHKNGLYFSITNGTAEYELTALNDGSITYKMKAKDVAQIYDPTNDQILIKTDLRSIRRLDPDSDDGSATDNAANWVPIADYRIRLYVPEFENNTLYVDGKITPVALVTMSDYPTIPYEYQESFIEYVKALTLDYEDDARVQDAKIYALSLIRADIADDMTSNEEFHGFKHPDEIKTRYISDEDLNRILWFA
jgi:hypothetical protein